LFTFSLGLDPIAVNYNFRYYLIPNSHMIWFT
jgi:hypothetical protein